MQYWYGGVAGDGSMIVATKFTIDALSHAIQLAFLCQDISTCRFYAVIPKVGLCLYEGEPTNLPGGGKAERLPNPYTATQVIQLVDNWLQSLQAVAANEFIELAGKEPDSDGTVERDGFILGTDPDDVVRKDLEQYSRPDQGDNLAFVVRPIWMVYGK